MNTEKSNEINKITHFVKNLQDGYLQDIFKDILPMITNAIENDMCFISFHELMQEKIQLTKDILDLKKEKHNIEINIKSLQNNNDFLENSAKDAKQKLTTMAQMMLKAV